MNFHGRFAVIDFENILAVNLLSYFGLEEHFVERADLLNRPLRTRMVGGVGATVRSRCLPD